MVRSKGIGDNRHTLSDSGLHLKGAGELSYMNYPAAHSFVSGLNQVHRFSWHDIVS